MSADFERRRLFQTFANDAIRLYFAPTPNEFAHLNVDGYKPEMVYQIFGNNELIYGYRDLKIDIYFSTSNGQCLVDITYSEIADVDERRGLKPDNILGLLEPWFPQGFHTNKEAYIKQASVYNTKPFGNCINKFCFPLPNGEKSTFLINICDVSQPGFKEFHQCFEPILIFYIEGANFIDIEDDKWSVVYLYEERHCGDTFIYTLAGMCTMYNFYKNPYTNRCRISQMLILPSYQRLGLGTHLLTSVYSIFNHTIPNIKELTVESPNSKFTKIRDRLDCKLLIELGSFNRENVRSGLTKKMIIDAMLRAKINKSQCEKVYRIMRMLYTDLEDEQDIQLLKADLKRSFHKDLVKQYYRSLRRCAFEEKIEKYDLLLNVPEIHEDYLERQYSTFYRATKPIVEQLKPYRSVQPRRPMQLLLQKF